MAEYESFVLGADKSCIVSTDCSKTMLNNNILVVGGTGSGKTVSVLEPMLLGMESSNAVGVFTKKRIIRDAKKILEGKGYRVNVLDFTGGTDSTVAYDPLACCETDGDIRDLAESIVTAAITGNEVGHDPYWNDSASGLIEVVLRYVRNGHYRKNGYTAAGMSDALELLDELRVMEQHDDESHEEYELRLKNSCRLYAEMDKLAAKDPVGNTVWQSFLQLGRVTASCVVSTARTALNQIFTPDVRKNMGTARLLEFAELTKEKRVLLVYISPVSIAQHRLVSIFYAQLFQQLFELGEDCTDGVLPHPIHILCDDFATGARIKNFSELISIFREKRISVVMLIQSLSQLTEMYNREAATTIVNNCDTLIYLGGMDIGTCEDIACRLDKPVQDVLTMPIGKEYFFRRGQKPVITSRFSFAEKKAALLAEAEKKLSAEKSEWSKNMMAALATRALAPKKGISPVIRARLKLLKAPNGMTEEKALELLIHHPDEKGMDTCRKCGARTAELFETRDAMNYPLRLVCRCCYDYFLQKKYDGYFYDVIPKLKPPIDEKADRLDIIRSRELKEMRKALKLQG